MEVSKIGYIKYRFFAKELSHVRIVMEVFHCTLRCTLTQINLVLKNYVSNGYLSAMFLTLDFQEFIPFECPTGTLNSTFKKLNFPYGFKLLLPLHFLSASPNI